MVTRSLAPSNMTSTPRPLAQELLRTRGQGIAVFVQQRVHSTSIGLEAASAFVKQLLQELESAVQVVAPYAASPESLQLSDDQEVKLGTLISAASLTIRYVTERDAMTPALPRFRDAFQAVLRFPLWTKPLLGLKMVALMGTTRLLESFGEHVATDDVAADLSWLFSLFVESEGDDFVMRVNCLLRPSCEQLTVAIQSHPAIHRMVFRDIVPQLIRLTTELDDKITDAVTAELLSAIAVVIDLKFPAPSKTAFSLLPLPSFAIEERSSEDNEDEDNIHIMQREGNSESASMPLVLPEGDDAARFGQTLEAWLAIEGRRRGVINNVAHISSAVVSAGRSNLSMTITKALLANLEKVEFSKAADFEYYLAGIEAIRDMGLRDALPRGFEQDIFSLMSEAMPRLQGALKSVDVDKSELRTIKSTCSTIRDTLVEALLWWIHHTADINSFDSLDRVVEKLADPRVHGDLLFVVRRSLQDLPFQEKVTSTATPLVRAVLQLDRYSKVAATRIVAGIARVAVGAGTAIVPFADALGGALMASVINGSAKGKAMRQRWSATACILISCAKDEPFVLEDHAWVDQLLESLLDASASHSVHALTSLEYLVRGNDKIRTYAAKMCASSQDTIGHIVHSSLASWPIFAEDMDAVLLVLALLSILLPGEDLRSSVDIAAMISTISTLRHNALSDDQSELVEACDDLLKALSK